MPFFSVGKFRKYYVLKNSLKRASLVKSIESLQVPGNFPLMCQIWPEKRVLPFTSRAVSASLTVEAAFSLSLFLLMAAALMQPVLWLDRQRKIQTAAEVFCGELSQYAYAEKFLPGGRETAKELEEDFGAGTPECFSKAAASLWLLGKAQQADIVMETVRIKKAEVPDEKGAICFEMEYKEKVPFFPISGNGIIMRAAVRRRTWIGLDGKLRGSGRECGEVAGDSKEELVYVGANMGRYHWYRDCHYISNQYQSISADQIARKKNSFGRSYTVCASCAGKDGSVRTFYITPGGEHYHTKPDCKAMISYVRQVPLNEVEFLGACSYCSRRKGD